MLLIMLLSLPLLRLSVFTAPSHAPALFCFCFCGGGDISKLSLFSAQSFPTLWKCMLQTIQFDLWLKSHAKPKDVSKSPTPTCTSLPPLQEKSQLFPSSGVIRQTSYPSKTQFQLRTLSFITGFL